MSYQHYQKVLKSPINTSISKNLYSFPKTQRFSQTRRSPCTRSFYDIKTTLNTPRATTLGFGNRSNLINQQAVPEPGHYQYNLSPFKQNKLKKRGFSFGAQIKTGFPYEQIDRNNPGPGKYDTFFKQQKGFSIRSKYQDPLEKSKNPLGPGQYRVTQNLNRTGNYFNSRFKNSLCGKIGKSSRFGNDHTEAPGPGKYQDKLDINRSGSYFNSRFKSNYVASFHGTSRPLINRQSDAPAPGTYFYFSQFGSRFSK